MQSFNTNETKICCECKNAFQPNNMKQYDNNFFCNNCFDYFLEDDIKVENISRDSPPPFIEQIMYDNVFNDNTQQQVHQENPKIKFGDFTEEESQYILKKTTEIFSENEDFPMQDCFNQAVQWFNENRKSYQPKKFNCWICYGNNRNCQTCNGSGLVWRTIQK
jgi:recombinational DNA repair protein (RecF pathway)